MFSLLFFSPENGSVFLPEFYIANLRWLSSEKPSFHKNSWGLTPCCGVNGEGHGLVCVGV